MVAAVREPDSHAAMDTALNLLWPGLGQLNQGRTGPAACLAFETFVLVVVFGAYPDSRTLMGIAIAVLTVWSMADVLIAARHRS
jgi:hypothetical protein